MRRQIGETEFHVFSLNFALGFLSELSITTPKLSELRNFDFAGTSK